jgi:uncharacterized protein
MRLRIIALYCALAIALSWGFQALAVTFGGDINSDAAGVWLAATMLTPLALTIGFLILHPPARRGFLWKPSWPMWPLLAVGFIVPTLTAFAYVAIMQAAGWGDSGWFAFGADDVSVAGGPWVLGLGPQDWGRFIANVLLTAAMFSALNGLVAAGEEFAWRGFLQGQLVRRFGLTKGVAILGLFWAAWHFPAQALGYNHPDYPLLGAVLLSPIELIASSFFLAWLTIRAGSFWPAAIAHGAVNSIREGVISDVTLTVPPIHEDMVLIALEIVVGLFCWAALRRSRLDSSGSTTGTHGL